MAISGNRFEALLVDGATWVLGLALTWALLLLVAGACEHLTARRWRALDWVGCPRAWRPVVALAVSTLLTLPTAATASTRVLPVPERPHDRAQEPTPRTTHAAPVATPAVVVVRQGDTLWRLTEQRLGDDAPARTVEASVRRLHAANRDVIGADPDLIHPGQRLRLPDHLPDQLRGARP